MTNLLYETHENMTEAEYQLRYAVFVLEQKMAHEEEFENDEDKFFHCHMYTGEELIACARLGQVTNGAIRIGRIAVRKDLRKNGLGKKIVEYAEHIGCEKGYDKFFLIAQTYAKGFYEKMGYVTEGSEFVEAGIPHIKMIKIFQKN
jgi:predicted GNAT family N-acyltransferase